MSKPSLGFDTTTLNRLTDAGDSDALLAGLSAGFHVRLTGTNVEEIIATSNPTRRAALLATCRLLLGGGDCILPFQVIVSKHIIDFYSNGRSFEWQQVNVRFRDCEMLLSRPEGLDSDLPDKQRLFAIELDKQFSSVFENAKAPFEELFAANRTERPTGFADSLARLQVAGGAYWTMAAAFYQKVTKVTPDEQSMRFFVSHCPPYRALLDAIFIAQFDRCFRVIPDGGPSLRAGAIDLYSAAYLPYCELFVTDDRRQRECLKQVASEASIVSAVLSYQELRSRLEIIAGGGV